VRGLGEEEEMTAHKTPSDRWEELKARGNATLSEIDSIDRDTPWAEVEPRWWLEMMDFRRTLHGRIECLNQTGIGSM
jgi:hypothetical protein